MIFVANLDCELKMARRSGQRGEPLPFAAQRTASALGTLLRAFASPGDRVWTLRPVDADRLPEVEGLSPVELVSGPVPTDDDAMFWGGTDEIDAAVNDRRFAAGIAERHGWALPGSAVLFSIWAVENHVANGGAGAAPGGRWVAKSPYSAAGRARAMGAGREVDRPAIQRLQRLLNTQDALLFEPWMERTEDFGVTGRITDDGPCEVRAHELLTDDRGLFKGVVIDPGFEAPAEVKEAARVAGEALHARGYRGPFGTDAWRARDAEGRSFVHPLGEINARLTFGHVTRRLAERLGKERIALRIGHASIPDGVVPLLLPGGEDGTAAWLSTG